MYICYITMKEMKDLNKYNGQQFSSKEEIITFLENELGERKESRCNDGFDFGSHYFLNGSVRVSDHKLPEWYGESEHDIRVVGSETDTIKKLMRRGTTMTEIKNMSQLPVTYTLKVIN